jgi:hypothetical protein
MDPVQQRILKKLRRGSRGRVFTPKDLVRFASRAATDQALSRLVRSGAVRRVGRGLYYVPKVSKKLGIEVPPDLDDIAQAVGRQTGSRVVPTGAVAANRLGLSTQVGATPVYLTDGRTRTVRAGKFVIQLKHVAPKELPAGGRTSAMVFQALRYLGRPAVDDGVVKLLRRQLSPRQRRELLRDAQYAASWIAELAQRVADGREIPAHG